MKKERKEEMLAKYGEVVKIFGMDLSVDKKGRLILKMGSCRSIIIIDGRGLYDPWSTLTKFFDDLQKAYEVRSKINPNAQYILIDHGVVSQGGLLMAIAFQQYCIDEMFGTGENPSEKTLHIGTIVVSLEGNYGSLKFKGGLNLMRQNPLPHHPIGTKEELERLGYKHHPSCRDEF